MTRLPLALRCLSYASANLVLAFLILPILAVVPASFNRSSFIRLPPERYAMRWYEGRRVVHRCVVAAEHHLHALQAQHPVRFGPAPVVADDHAGHPAVRGPGTEAQVADLEVALFQVLERRLGPVLRMARQVDLAVFADDRAVAADQDGAVEAAFAACLHLELTIAEVKADAKAPRFIE